MPPGYELKVWQGALSGKWIAQVHPPAGDRVVFYREDRGAVVQHAENAARLHVETDDWGPA